MLGVGDFNVRGDTSYISPFDSMFFSFSFSIILLNRGLQRPLKRGISGSHGDCTLNPKPILSHHSFTVCLAHPSGAGRKPLKSSGGHRCSRTSPGRVDGLK